MGDLSFNIIRKNSAFYSHNVFVCFIRFSQHTVIISLQNLNRMVFTVHAVCSL